MIPEYCILFLIWILLQSDLRPDLIKRLHRPHIFTMFAEHLLHPDHIIPFSEFPAAFMKPSDQFIAGMLMKAHAVVRQKLILRIRKGDAGIEIEDSLRRQRLFKPAVQRAAHAAAPRPSI